MKKIINILIVLFFGFLFSIETISCKKKVLDGVTTSKEGYATYVTTYKNGIKNGWSVIRFDFQPRRREQYYYVNGVKHGWAFESWTEGDESRYYQVKSLYWNGKKIGERCRYEVILNQIQKNYTDMDVNLSYDIDSNIGYMPNESLEPFFGYGGMDYYHYDNLLDQIKETVWVSKEIILNEIYVTLNKFNNKHAKNLVIVNGNRENDAEYYKFSRIKEANIVISVVGRERIEKSIIFNDNFETKKIPIMNNKNIIIYLRIKSIYPGTKYQNVAISDFYLEF